MSGRNKRQKRSDDGKNDSELNSFRLSVVGLIDEKIWNVFVDKVIHWRNFGKKRVKGRKFFSEYTEQEKVDLFLSMKKFERNLRLEKCMKSRNVKISEMREVYKKHINDPKKLSKQALVTAILSRFNNEELDINKRDTEKEVISETDLTNLFVIINGHTIPKDILIYIFSFLSYDMRLICGVGAVCKDFYVAILSSWKMVLISKKNLYKTSLLVLKSTRMVVFNSYLSVSELQFLFQNLSPDRIRTIVFYRKYSNNFLRTFFGAVSKLKKKSEKEKNSQYLFGRVTSILFRRHGNNSVWNRKLKMSDFDWKKFRLNDLFPSLNTLEDPPNLSLMNGLSLRKLTLTEFEKTQYERGVMVGVKKLIFPMTQLIDGCQDFEISSFVIEGWSLEANIGKLSHLDDFFSFFLGKGLKNLCFKDTYCNQNKTIDMRSFLSKTEQLESLEFHFSNNLWANTEVHQIVADFKSPLDLTNLRSLVVEAKGIIFKSSDIADLLSSAKSVQEVEFEFSMKMDPKSEKDRDFMVCRYKEILLSIFSHLSPNTESAILKVTRGRTSNRSFSFRYDADNFYAKYEKNTSELEIGCFGRETLKGWSEDHSGLVYEVKETNEKTTVSHILMNEALSIGQVLLQYNVGQVRCIVSKSLVFPGISTPEIVEEKISDVMAGQFKEFGRREFDLYHFPPKQFNLFRGARYWNMREKKVFGHSGTDGVYHSEYIKDSSIPFMAYEIVFRKL